MKKILVMFAIAAIFAACETSTQEVVTDEVVADSTAVCCDSTAVEVPAEGVEAAAE